jgi:soluble lytic murein transglycosylase-like protein
MSKKTIQQQAAVLNAKNAELRITKNEVDKLESKLAQIKTSEGLAARDLEAYILSKYKTVPRVLAKEIAMKAAKLTKEYSVPFSLIAGLIEVESGFKPWLTSPKGARGLMQVMPEWVKKRKDGGNKLGIAIEDESDMHDVEPNLRAGILVFKIHLREQNNNINSALFKYVGGDRSYANKVFSAMGRFVTFRSTLDTSLKDEDSEEDNKSEPEEIEGTKQLILTPPLGLKQIKSKLC